MLYTATKTSTGLNTGRLCQVRRLMSCTGEGPGGQGAGVLRGDTGRAEALAAAVGLHAA